MKFASKLCPHSCGSRWIITTKLKSICHKLHTIILHGNAINIMKPLHYRWWKHQYPSHSTVLITNLNPCISDNPQVPSAIKGYCLDDQLRVVVAVEPIERLSVGLVSIAVYNELRQAVGFLIRANYNGQSRVMRAHIVDCVVNAIGRDYFLFPFAIIHQHGVE